VSGVFMWVDLRIGTPFSFILDTLWDTPLA
jgi:hypothetical protein